VTNWPADSIERVPIDSLVPYANNARTHSDEQIAQIAASMQEWGWTNPILVDDKNMVIAGHGRLLAARKLGADNVPVMVAAGWTDAQKKAYVVADNKLAMNAGWDYDLLAAEVKSLEDLDFDIDLIGFSADELEDLLADPETEGLTDEDAVPEPPETPVTVLGDVWVLGNHRLMCGDSTSIDAVEKLMNGQKADMVFTDPPYGVDYDGGSKKRDKLADDHIGTDIYTEAVPIMAMFCNGPIYTWYADTKPKGLYVAVESVGEIHSLIIWKKNNSTFNMGINYKQKHEPCLYWKPKGRTLCWSGGSKEDTVWEIKREARNDFHPTQKPVELSTRAIGNHSVGLVLDLFGGSGATLIGCEKLNRQCRMMELDPKYCDVIITRWQDFTGKEAANQDGQTYNELKEIQQ
jgi:DNA modification methylase